MNPHGISTGCWDQRTLRELRNGALRLTEEKTYDRFGRLSKIKSGSSEVIYYYNSFNQFEKRLINNVPEYYYYTKYGQLRAKTLGAEEDKNPLTSLKYFYSRPGMIVAREVNGARQNYKYDKKYQLLGVYDDKENAIEEYVYDPAGNILKKTIHGKTTTYKYDKANQLVSSECKGKVTKYEYDAAGRLVKEGDKVYSYIGLDKIESVTENGRRLSSFIYHIDGQLAARVSVESSETFHWDGLALIQRNSTSYVNEPAVTGGNPILADDKILFNDMLGTTLGVKDGDKVTQNSLTAFGESLSTSPMQDSFFTGKPHVGEMGYVFLFRAYRADQGKWQTAAPLGYPDGWNNFAYGNNWITDCIDQFGCDIYHVLASGAVEGAGHSAAIVGNETFGYRIINHGAANTDPRIIHSWSNKYSTVSEALKALQSGRSGDDLFNHIQKWETTPAQDDIAYGKMLEGAANEYSWYSNNCWQVIRDGIYEAFYPNGNYYCDNSWIPNIAYWNNYINPQGPESLDFDQVMNGILE